MSPRAWRVFSYAITVLTVVAAIYETYAILSPTAPTISRYLHELAEKYHPVYFFAGLIAAFLVMVAVYGTHLPIFIRLQVLAWLMVFAHIFWTVF